ncbi:MAG: histidine kinase dimerization/phosphoacceptor domain -containing protein [Bacteroidota bacterium]
MNEISRKDLNKEFQDHYLMSSLLSIRLGLFLTLFLFFCFAISDVLFFPNTPEQNFYIHFLIILPVLIISVIVTYIRSMYKWVHLIYIIMNLEVGLALFYFAITTKPSNEGLEYYYSWVMLVVIGLFTFYRLQFITLISIGVFQVVAFVIASIYNGTYLQTPFVFFNNLFFILAIYIIGFLMAFMFRKLNWKNFLHTKVLSNNYRKLSLEIEERKQVEKSLQQSESLYINTLNSIPDWIYVVDRELRFVILNSSLQEEHLRQGFPINCIGKKITKIYPYIPSSTIDEINHIFSSGEIITGEQQFFLRDKTIYGETRKVPIFKDNIVIQVMIIMRNRSKEKEIEALKQKNIDQKETMLREIHHRVKNNLAIVISLLDLQLRNNSSPELHRIIKDIEMRIRSMALIHEHLYRSENLDRIPLATYLQSLSNIIMGTYSGQRINLVTRLDKTDIGIETALPLGLIANELLTNAFKYAFPHQREGKIEISLQQENADTFILTIKDNGVGLPDTFSMSSDKSLGLFIVKLLVEQIDGKINIERESGTTFTISFREAVVKKEDISLN